MKKTLLLSTALVAFAGMAAADVALSGRAEIGIFGSEADDDDADFFQDINVQFTMSGETDGGLTFGASVGLEDDIGDNGADSEATNNNDRDGDTVIFISGGFGTVTMGDTDGALDWALTEAGNINNGGSLADDETSHVGYLGSYLDGAYDGQVLRYDYSFGDFGVAISAEMDDSDTEDDLDSGYAIGFNYSGDMGGFTLNAGIGYQQAEVASTFEVIDVAVGETSDVDILGLSVGAEFTNGLAVGIQYTDWNVDRDSLDDIDASHVGVGIGYVTGALTLHANYGMYDVDDIGTADGYGISAAYDLGGGAVVHFGYSDGDIDYDSDTGLDDEDELGKYSLGLGLSF